MKNIELYNKTVDILLDAYNNGKLFHMKCSACAVGNIIAANNGYTLVQESKSSPKPDSLYWKESKVVWQNVFCTTEELHEVFEQSVDENKYTGKTKEQIDSTGYTWQELAKIEKAFEMSIANTDEGYYYWKDKKEGQYIGLCAVLDVLKEIHETKEEVHTENIEKLTEIKELVCL